MKLIIDRNTENKDAATVRIAVDDEGKETMFLISLTDQQIKTISDGGTIGLRI